MDPSSSHTSSTGTEHDGLKNEKKRKKKRPKGFSQIKHNKTLINHLMTKYNN
jgi:hypothetical protein